MPKDLLETELNYPPLNMSMQPRDLLEGQPFKTYNEQINDNISSDYGFTDDDKLIIGSIFTPEELDEIRKSKPMGLLEGIKKKGVWESVKEQGKEFWSQFKPVEAWQSVGKTMVDWKVAKEASEAKPDNETDEERRKRFEEVQKVMPNVKWEDFIKVKTNSVPNETYLREMLRDSYRDQIRGTTVSGMVGNILGEMPVFMAELYASGGTVSALKTGLKKAAPAMVKNAAEQTAKIAAKGKVANAAVKTTSLAGKASVMAAVSPTMLTKNYLDRKISGTIKATDKGNILLAEMDEKPYTTAAKSFMDTQVSIFSEQTGEAIVGAVGTAVKKVTSPVIAKFMASPKVAQARDAILREIRKFKPDLDMQKFMHDKLYYNGVLGEMSEERLEGVLRGVLQLNTDDERSTTDQILDALYPSKDQLLAELGAFTIAGSLPYASRAVKNMLSKKGLSEAQINEVLENKDQTEIDSIADELTTQERKAQLEETKKMNPDAADVTQYVFDTLYNAGISEKEATQVARVVTGYALAGAKATGMTPMEFFRQRFPKVQREKFADFQKQFEEKRAEAGFNPFELLINDEAYRKFENKVNKERGMSLLAFLKSKGGIKDSGGELKSRDIRKAYPGLINNKKGLQLDDAALSAWEHGYLPSEADYSGEMGRPSIDTLLEAIDDEISGNKRYSEQMESGTYKGLKEQLDMIDRLSQEMAMLGVDYSNMSLQEAEDAYKRASEEYMAAENADIDEAEEERRAIMEIDGGMAAAQNPTDEWDDIPFQFAGEKAQTAALDELDNAKQLEADGVDNEEIRQQTGWFKGVDGKWRFEISDEDAKMLGTIEELLKKNEDKHEKTLKKLAKLEKERDKLRIAVNKNEITENEYYSKLEENDKKIQTQMDNDEAFKVKDIISHEKLFDAYPWIANINVFISERIDPDEAYYDERTKSITVGKNVAKEPASSINLKGIILHEIQHAIQFNEKFARGGSPDDFDSIEQLRRGLEQGKQLLDEANEALETAEDLGYSDDTDINGMPVSFYREQKEQAQKQIDYANERISNYKDPYQKYKSLYGEIEARNTAIRSEFTEELRGKISPERTQDIKNADAIVIFGDGTAMAYEPETYYQSAYHGSPHPELEGGHFSIDKVGSGEGAAAHGWGAVYASLTFDTAEGYRKRLTQNNAMNDMVQKYGVPRWDIEEIVEKGKDGVIKKYKRQIELYQNWVKEGREVNYSYSRIENAKETIKDIESIPDEEIEKIRNSGGQTYELDIPENPYLLDEQKSYKEQSDFVKEALQKAEMDLENPSYKEKIFDNRKEAIDFYDSKIDEFEEKADGYQRFMPQSFLTKDGKYGVKYVDDYTVYGPLIGDFSDITGEGIYNRIAHRLGSQKAASQFLEKYGIKGITYEGRQDGRCFVIFNPDDVKVIQKFYQNAERGKGVAKGAYTGSDNVIHLFETADASTFMHETAHWFKRELRRFGTDRSREMLKKVDAWENTEFAKRYKVELKDGYYRVTDTKGKTVYDNKFGTEKEATEYAKEELFARGFEQYLRTGKAPSSYLKEAFDAFMEWLKQIYRTVKSLDVDLNDEIEEVYAAMVGGKELDDYVYGAQETQATSKENAPAPQDDDVPFDMVYRDAVEEVKPTKQEVAEVVTTIKSAQDIAESIEPTTKEEQKGWWSGLYDIYNKVRTAVVGNEATAQSMEEYSEGWWSLFRRHFTDYLSGLEKIDADIYKRARVNAGLGGNIINALTNRVQRLDKNGNIEDLGEGLMPILKDFRAEFGVSMAQTEKDLGDYMIARRYLEDLQNREDVKVTDKQIEESLNKVDALKKKYSAQVIRFKEYAERLYDYQKRISHFLVDSELMTEEKWQDMINKNPNYIPFYRILEDNGMQTDSFVRPVTSNGFNRSHPTIKKIKGSELDIRSPFASIVNNTTNVLRNAYKNNVARAVADLKDVYPNLVREKKPLMEHGKVKMKVSFDKGLRDALLNGIEQLGAKFTKAKTLNQKGERGLVLGDYNPQEKLVRERLGVDNALTHEFGHLLDFELGLGRWIIDSTTRKELEKLAEERLHYETQAVEDDNGDIRFERVLEQEPTPKFDAYIKNDREIIANLYDAYINAPEMLDKIAPKAKKKLEQALDKSGYKWLKDIKRTLDKGIEEIEQDAWVKSNVMPSGNTISYRQKGVKKYIEVHKKLYTALNGIDKSTRYPVIKAFFTVPEKILRLTTTTWSAAFTVRNMIRDTMEASINANVGFMPIISTLRGMYDVVTKSDVYKDWMASGGSFDSFMEVNENSERNPYEELFGNISKWQYINPLKWIEAFGNLGEQATRVSIYRLAKQKGRSNIDASILSRGSTVDFARGGDWAKVANQYSAFLNAGIQGTSAMMQAFKERPVQTTIKALAYITLPSILETGYYLYMAPDDDREEYLELPSWRKDLFWNFKVGDLWFMLPKPFTYGMVFGTIPQAMMIADYKNEDTDWKHLFEETLGTMNPLQDFGTYFPKLIKELIEQQLNKDFYTDRQIVPFFMEKRDPEFQYTDNTSDLAKEVGKIIGYSPAKIEHAVTSIFGTLSKDLMAAYDLWSNEDGVTKEWGELPVIRGFVNTQPIGNRSQSVQDYYDLYNDAFSAYTTYNSLKKESKEKAEEYAEENKSRLNLYEHLKPYEKRRKEIAQEIKYIRNNDSMAPQAKKDAIDYLNKEMTANAREALKLKKDDAVLNETTEDRIKYNLWGTRNKVLADDSVIKEIARLNELEIRPTMTDPTETTKLSYLNNEQRKEARQKYADAYNAVVSQIIRTPEYRNAKDKEKKDMINKVRTHIVNLLKKEYKVK